MTIRECANYSATDCFVAINSLLLPRRNLFLEDMASHRDSFCSSSLVNIAWAPPTYGPSNYSWKIAWLIKQQVCHTQFVGRAQWLKSDKMMYSTLAEVQRL